MTILFRKTTAYQTLLQERGEGAQTNLVLFPDEKYLRFFLKECAKAFFGAKEGSREEGLIESESFLDCIFLPVAGGKLTVEDGVRIIEESSLRPVEGSKKLFVLDNFHTASTLVQNKLLKLLEEPPQGVYFLLGATAEFSVLPTVLSRARKFAVALFHEQEIATALSRKYGNVVGVDQAAAACGGVFSMAETLLSGGGEDFACARAFLRGENVEALCRALGEKKEKRAFFMALKLLLRDMLLYRTGQEKFVASDLQEIKTLCKKYSAKTIVRALDGVAQAEKEIQFNANLGQCAYHLYLKITTP